MHLDNLFFEFFHRWREPTRTWFSQTQEINHWEMLKNRPTTTHYDHGRGNKYEVAWTYDQKFPHVANRLGYPMFQSDPIEEVFGIERAQAHPGYQFQPFLQTPSMEPDPSLSFEKGDVIYENHRVAEWIRFWRVLTASVMFSWPGFYTFEIYQADGFPSLTWLAETAHWFPAPMQFQDGGDLGLESYRYCDDHDYMNFPYSVKRTIARTSHTFYCLSVLIAINYMDMDYATKM